MNLIKNKNNVANNHNKVDGTMSTIRTMLTWVLRKLHILLGGLLLLLIVVWGFKAKTAIETLKVQLTPPELAQYQALPNNLLDDYQDSLFILDTRQPGNFNTGHEFSDKVGQGVIGRKLNEKWALIAYLKTL